MMQDNNRLKGSQKPFKCEISEGMWSRAKNLFGNKKHELPNDSSSVAGGKRRRTSVDVIDQVSQVQINNNEVMDEATDIFDQNELAVEEAFTADELSKICDRFAQTRYTKNFNIKEHVQSLVSKKNKKNLYLNEDNSLIYPGCPKTTASVYLGLASFVANANLETNKIPELVELLQNLVPADHKHKLDFAKIFNDLFVDDYLSFDICPCNQFVYVGENKTFVKCPKCTASRYRSFHGSSHNTRTAAKIVSYRPILMILIELLKSECFLPLLKWKPVDLMLGNRIDKVVDITTTDVFREQMNQMENNVSDERYNGHEKINLLISFSYDGAQVRKHAKCEFWPLAISFLNLPPSHRNVYDIGMFVVSILSQYPGIRCLIYSSISKLNIN